MSSKPTKPADPISGLVVGSLAEWVRGKTLAELVAIEVGEDQFFPETIARFDFKAKTIIDVPVMLRIPTMLEMAACKARSMRWLCRHAEQEFAGWDHAKACSFFGEHHVEHVENVFILSDAIRRREQPTTGYMSPEQLDKMHPVPAIATTMAKLKALRDLLDTRISADDVVEEGVLWACVAAIAEKGNLSPLVGIAPLGQNALLLSIACRLDAYRRAQSSPSSPPK